MSSSQKLLRTLGSGPDGMLLRDMHLVSMHVVIAKPLRTFARHALAQALCMKVAI
jgi:hypothetical protein